MNEPKEIEATITIRSTYDDMIWIEIEDKPSGIRFVRVELTREQFINATMNQLGNTDVKHAEIRGLDKVGKIMEQKEFAYLMPSDYPNYISKDIARNMATQNTPTEWIPDMGFDRQNSFFEKNGNRCARTTIRRWV